MPNVYECNLCGRVLLGRGCSLHLARVHGVTDEEAGVIDESLDLKIDIVGVPYGNAGYQFKLGSVVARYLFEVGGEYSTRFIRGDLRVYKLWVSSRLRKVKERTGAIVQGPTYLEDFIR